MAAGSRSTAFHGSELVRLLDRLGIAGVPAGDPPLVDTLGSWLHWTDAIALAGALSGGPEGAAPGAPGRTPAPAAELERVRHALTRTIDDDRELDQEPDLAAWRRLYQERQQTMERATTALRAGLRATLARRGGEAARLAAADAALDAAMAPREKAALAALPGLVDAHWRRRTPQPDASARQAMRAELRALLRAELELRLLPAQGLVDALADGPATSFP